MRSDCPIIHSEIPLLSGFHSRLPSSEDLVKDKVANDRPVWKMRGGERWLYLTTAAGPMELQGRGLTRVAS